MKRKCKYRRRLDINEICHIVHAAIVNLEKHSDIAKEFRIHPYTISRYVSKCKKNKEYLRELLDKRDAIISNRTLIADFVDNMLSAD